MGFAFVLKLSKIVIVSVVVKVYPSLLQEAV